MQGQPGKQFPLLSGLSFRAEYRAFGRVIAQALEMLPHAFMAHTSRRRSVNRSTRDRYYALVRGQPFISAAAIPGELIGSALIPHRRRWQNLLAFSSPQIVGVHLALRDALESFGVRERLLPRFM
jgi:hypothetical protein